MFALGLLLSPAARSAPNPAGHSPTVSVTVSAVDSRFVTREHFLASVEMQVSGEPLAQAMGRILTGYRREVLPPDLYFPDATANNRPDVVGFSTAVETYEYSKVAMNSVAFESGAGTSLLFAPLLNPAGKRGDAARKLMYKRIIALGRASHAFDHYLTTEGHWRGTSKNPLAYPGIWPTLHLFRSFDPAADPTSAVSVQCSIVTDNDSDGDTVADYECDPSSLHLRDREKQIEPVITPGADGFSTWKYALWTLNYLQLMHDTSEQQVVSVPEAELAKIGTPVNSVTGKVARGYPSFPGTYLGSSDMEGFQSGMFIEMADNRAEDWLRHLSTADGKTLSGFSSLAAALRYDEDQPLRWFPSAVAVKEAPDASGFPRPSYAVGSADSELLDLAGLVAGYATFYPLTDRDNPGVGGTQMARAYFDGNPFPADNGKADGQSTLHDRALAMIRVGVLDMDRIHRVDAGLLVDQAYFDGKTLVAGSRASVLGATYSIVALRTVLRSLSSQLQLYSNNTPDTAVMSTPLDGVPTRSVGMKGELAFSEKVRNLLRAEAGLLYDGLTTADGHAFSEWDVTRKAPVDTEDRLDAHTAAIRGLLSAFLATGDIRFRDRAARVYQRMEKVFYDEQARLYTPGPAAARPSEVEYTPVRFAVLQAALRDVDEQLVLRPGASFSRAQLEKRLARLNKLVLNGWDDRNGDGKVDWPGECAQVKDGLPRGALQMAERTLTGESGSIELEINRGDPRTPTSDRDHDCVPEIDDAHVGAGLARSVTFHIQR